MKWLWNSGLIQRHVNLSRVILGLEAVELRPFHVHIYIFSVDVS